VGSGILRCMKRLVVILTVAAFAIGPAQAAVHRPRLWLAAPNLVAGGGFHSAERLTVSVSSPSLRAKKTVSATMLGTLRARFVGRVTFDACHAAVLTAIRPDGARVTTKLGGGSKDCAPRIDAG
jgi:hypothetical protein